jgi:hypothetical protein
MTVDHQALGVVGLVRLVDLEDVSQGVRWELPSMISPRPSLAVVLLDLDELGDWWDAAVGDDEEHVPAGRGDAGRAGSAGDGGTVG